jgi:Leucine-rich repeat (LRR) protein
LKRLRRLNLIENEINTAAEFEGHPNLEILELGKNKLKTTEGLGNMPKLRVK